ncbi:MAG: exopolysaccharide biosynthesis protein [Candidatus Cloacimonetes bacterium]|nr:exopolysaccharide biosynthesis protein [Candidatus Cloacimonadota bacterium]
MIDIHTHILPGIDDGAPDIETSVQAMRAAVDAGITDVVCTSHFLRGQYHNPRSITLPLMQELQALARKHDIPLKLHIGAEVMLDSTIPESIGELELFIADTHYVLVESEINAMPVNFLDLLFEIVRRGWKPVLAHPERYPAIMSNLSIAEDLLHRNVHLQINSGSLLGGYGGKVQETAWKMIERGCAHFLASDTHARGNENTLKKATELLTERFDAYTVELLTRINPAKLLADEPIDYVYLNLVKQPKQQNLFTRARDFLLGR